MRYLAILLGTPLLLAALLFCLTLSLAPAPVEAEYWVREMMFIKRHLARQNQGRPQILVVGGSNVLFGIDAKQMTEQLGVPVVNFGLQAGLSLETLLEEADAASRPGDTVILGLEWGYYRNLHRTDWQYRNMMAWNPSLWKSLPLTERAKAIYLLGPTIVGEVLDARYKQRYHPDQIARRLRALDETAYMAHYPDRPKPTEFSYISDNIDEFGTMQLNIGTKRNITSKTSPEITETQPANLRLLQAFVTHMRAKSVAVYFAEPPYFASPEDRPAEIAKASDQLAQALAPIGKVLGTRNQLVFEPRYFFNSALHLNTEGRKLRTQILIDEIKKDPQLMQRLKGN